MFPRYNESLWISSLMLVSNFEILSKYQNKINNEIAKQFELLYMNALINND